MTTAETSRENFLFLLSLNLLTMSRFYLFFYLTITKCVFIEIKILQRKSEYNLFKNLANPSSTVLYVCMYSIYIHIHTYMQISALLASFLMSQ